MVLLLLGNDHARSVVRGVVIVVVVEDLTLLVIIILILLIISIALLVAVFLICILLEQIVSESLLVNEIAQQHEENHDTIDMIGFIQPLVHLSY